MSDSSAGDGSHDRSGATAAEAMLRSLRDHGVDYMFANYGTDHTPLLEAAARVRETDPDAIPEYVVCPHESVAMSAAHGYAAVTGRPQAVVVHVDAGTQNLGAMVHNAFRGEVPVFVFSGLAPVTDDDAIPGARDNRVHYLQDVFDQPGIVRQYCRWLGEYKPPADPDEVVVRGLEQAATPPGGPVYVSSTREALETPVADLEARRRDRTVRTVESPPPADADVEAVADLVAAAEAPLVITGQLGMPPGDPADEVDALVSFAEAAGAGVVEYGPETLCFPRDHDLHVGFDPTAAFDVADLVLLAAVDVPWLPTDGEPAPDASVVQLDVDPTKPTYPKWDFRVDHTVNADPAKSLRAIAERLGDTGDGTEWREIAAETRSKRSETVKRHRDDGVFSPQVLAAAIDEVVTEDTVVVDEAVTNSYNAVLPHIELSEPGSYYSSHGSGLGWCGGAPIGVKLAEPDRRVISVAGDGAYVFGNPTAMAWTASVIGAPTLTVVFNNSGWNAVKASTLRAHPAESAAGADVPESKFDPTFDLTHAAKVVEDAYTAAVTDLGDLAGALRDAVDSVDAGRPAVLDARIDRI